MKKHGWKEKWQYRFDQLMSRGTVSLIAILFGITLAVVLVSGALVALLDPEHGSTLARAAWMSLMHTIDGGTIAGDEGGWPYLLLMMVVTICGIFITSMLIGILSTGLTDKIEALRKGKSLVLEKDHVVILGFNENTLNMLSELVLANENRKDGVVLVMDDRDKTEMEDLIHQRIPDTKTTRIICRSGQADSFDDLAICSLETCRSVILNLDRDFRTIKAVLACVNLLRKSDNRDAYVTAIIREEGNLEAARIAGGDRAEILYFKRTIARLMAHASRQPGISNVFTGLLGYAGDEIYVESIPGCAGLSVWDLNLRFPRSTVIGIVRDGQPKVNPAPDTVLGPEDQVILMEEDDGVSHLAETAAVIDVRAFAEKKDIPDAPQKTLILGSGDLLELVLEELDNYAAPGSLVIAADTDWPEEQTLPRPRNMQLEQRCCNIYTRQVLEELLAVRPEHVLILTDTDCDDEEADARTLMLLLQLRNLARLKQLNFTITSEMRSARNQELAKVTHVNDFVISSNITALMMTQISQNRHQRAILEDLLDDEGSEFYRKPIGRYVQCGQPVDFYTVGAAAARYGEIAVGYQRLENGEVRSVCNPEKGEKLTFAPGDALIVIAEN